MASLKDLLRTLSAPDDDQEQTIYAAQPWSPDSTAVVADDDAIASESELAYMLEVDLALEAIEVWEKWHSRGANDDDRCRAVIHYATHDAYLDENEEGGVARDPGGSSLGQLPGATD